MKMINPLVHGVLDYALAILFLLLPGLLGFGATPSAVSHAIGGVYIIAALVTRYPLGLVKVLPFPVHGVLESLMAASWIYMPWFFGFSDDAPARNFFITAGIGLLLVAMVTKYRGGERRTGGEERRMSQTAVEHDRRSRLST
jgi:hypothetical protein